MRLPKQIRIGGIDYTVQPRTFVQLEGKSGTHSRMEATIEIANGVPQETANTLLHEVLHGCYQQAELRADDSEERIVSALSNQLCQVFRDNPKFVSWLTKGVKRSA